MYHSCKKRIGKNVNIYEHCEFGTERIKVYLKGGFLVRVKEYAYKHKHKHKSKRVYAYELIGMSSFTLLQTLRDHLEGSYSTPA